MPCPRPRPPPPTGWPGSRVGYKHSWWVPYATSQCFLSSFTSQRHEQVSVKSSPLGAHYLVAIGFSQRKESPEQSTAQGTFFPLKKGRRVVG